ncbi:MAG: NADH-quinone oxidoreductase subunit C [Holosporales bacterium]|jgi:NADH:ubiquinone oxidoreductase subunit C|nr:NADH-quinone oxidoreductase subunit C [Holosporales bacterium]
MQTSRENELLIMGALHGNLVEEARVIGSGDSELDAGAGQDMYIAIEQSSLLKGLVILSTSSKLLFQALTDCFATKEPLDKQKLTVFYQLHSYHLSMTIFICTTALGEAVLQSVTAVYSNARWYEREIQERYGITFTTDSQD